MTGRVVRRRLRRRVTGRARWSPPASTPTGSTPPTWCSSRPSTGAWTSGPSRCSTTSRWWPARRSAGSCSRGSVQWLRPNERERLVGPGRLPPGGRRGRWCSTRPPPRGGGGDVRPWCGTWPPGDPLHAETWAPPARPRGFAVAATRHRAATTGGSTGWARRTADADAVNAAIDAINDAAARAGRSTSWSPRGSGDRRPPVRAGAAAPGRHRRPHPGPARRLPGRRAGTRTSTSRPPTTSSRTRPPTSSSTRSGPGRVTSCSTSWAPPRRWPSSCSAGPSRWCSTTTTSRPPSFYEGWEDHTAAKVALARHQVAALAPRAVLGIADSAFNAARARRRSAARPPRWSPSWSDVDGPGRGRSTSGSWPGWRPPTATPPCCCSSGRISPNKGQQHLVEALWLYRRLVRPRRPAPPGGPGRHRAYAEAVFAFAEELGLGDAVRHGEDLTAAELAAWYADADVFVCLSEHEGFCIPLLEAMRSGTADRGLRRRGGARDPRPTPACCSTRSGPATVAAAVDRVRRDPDLADVWSAPAAGGSGDFAAPVTRRAVRRGAGRRSTPEPGGGVKLAFVTPRYGTEVIGGAETAARMLAERLCLRPGLGGGGADQLCPRPPHVGEHRAGRAPRCSNGVTVHRFPTASRRHPRLLRARRQAAGVARPRRRWPSPARWVALNGPDVPRTWSTRWPTTDADVVACYPYLFATTVDAIAVSRVPTVLHPAAHDEPALYLSRVPPELPGHRRVRVPHPGRAGPDGARLRHRGPTPDRARARGQRRRPGRAGRAGTSSGIGDRPYLCYLGRVDEHKGCGMLAEYFAEYKERHPGDLALAFVGPGVGQGTRPSGHRGDRHGVRGRQVGHPGRRRGRW